MHVRTQKLSVSGGPAPAHSSLVARAHPAPPPRMSSRAVADGSASERYRLGRDFSGVPAHASSRIPSSLRIGGPGDQREREADQLVEQVVPMAPGAVKQPASQGNWGSDRGSGQALSARERSLFEPRFGHGFGQVRVHADAKAADMARALNAEAFTVGRDIYLDRDTPRRGPQSDRMLAHELAHVVQQSRTGPALQPKLKMTGTPANLERTMRLLNMNMGGFYHASVDKSGEVKLDPVRAAHTSSITGPSAQEKALADRLWTVITDSKEVALTVSAGSKTLGGSYNTGDFDIADLETYGVPGLIHEIEEQYQKQIKGKAFGSDTSGAHSEAISAESEVRGAKRGAQKMVSSTQNPDRTIDAVIEIPHTFPDGKVKTMVMTIKSNNIVSVVWR